MKASSSLPPPVVLPCGACWIEFELLDEHDQPVAREPFWVRLPNGQVREGRLDDKGFLRLAPIPCGLCQVRFPRIDGTVVRQVASHPAELEWIEIQLLGPDQSGVANEAFKIVLPGGRVVVGNLDERGFARIDAVPRGDCQVSFPHLDRSDTAKV